MKNNQILGSRLRVLVTTAVVVTATATVAATAPAATAATGDVVRAVEPVAGEYIVVLSEGKAAVDAPSMARRYGGAVLHTWTAALNGFAVRLTAASAARLAGDPRVESVQENGLVRTAQEQLNPPWGLDRIDQRYVPLDSRYRYDTMESTVRAYILDTGIRTTHQEFGGRATLGYDAIGDGDNGQDCVGHGTHVAGTVGGATYGVAKAVRLVSVRIFPCIGPGTVVQLISGVDWVTANAMRPAVANISIGAASNGALDLAVRNSIASGITYVVSAGNDNQDACNQSPARVAEAITVGATDATDIRATFPNGRRSNYGGCLDLFAPGVGITSAWRTSDAAIATLSGTSMASPHAAGVAARYLAANPLASPAQVRNAVVAKATKGVVVDHGICSPNRLLHLRVSGTLGLSLASGPTGTEVHVTGSGFAANEYVQILFGGVAVGAGFSQPDGSYTDHFFVPAALPGVHLVEAIGQSSGNHNSMEFTVPGGSAPQCIPGALNSSPTSGSAGTEVLVTGAGYSQGEVVRMYFAGAWIGGGTSQSDALYTDRFFVPTASPGTYLLEAVGQYSGHRLSMEFAVT